MFSSYQKQALTVMISPLCTNCHDITVILLNVALNTINLTNSWRTQYISEQWEFVEINLNHRRILKLNYVGNIIEWVV
jgi:hypothetical protein